MAGIGERDSDLGPQTPDLSWLVGRLKSEVRRLRSVRGYLSSKLLPLKFLLDGIIWVR
jgi:hypothetical protein